MHCFQPINKLINCIFQYSSQIIFVCIFSIVYLVIKAQYSRWIKDFFEYKKLDKKCKLSPQWHDLLEWNPFSVGKIRKSTKHEKWYLIKNLCSNLSSSNSIILHKMRSVNKKKSYCLYHKSHHYHVTEISIQSHNKNAFKM